MKKLVVVAVIALAATAHADARHAPIVLRLDESVGACIGGDLDAVRRVVVVELGADLVSDPGPDATLVDVTCAGDEATIRVDDPITDKRTERRLPLADQPLNARPRLLGLAIVETVASSWVELEMKVTPAIRAKDETAPSGEVRDRAAATARSRLIKRPNGRSAAEAGISLVGRRFTDGGLVTLGARLDGAWALSARFWLALDLAVEHGGVSVDAGDVDVTLLSLNPRVEARLDSGPLVVKADLGFRIGIVDFSGQPRMPTFQTNDFQATWGGPAAAIEGRTALARHFGLSVGFEAGLVTLSARAQVDGVDAANVDQGWGAAWVALTYLP